jgi:hypothetical protein
VPNLTNTQKKKGELDIKNSSIRRQQQPAMTKKARVALSPAQSVEVICIKHNIKLVRVHKKA